VARFIAEIGSNHNRSLERSQQLIDACAAAGAGAVKLQIFHIEDLFTPEVLAVRPDLRARRDWEFPLDLIDPVARHTRERGLEFGVTPFGLWAVEALAPDVDFFKVASYELLWHDLIRACSATGRPLIISTGMATIDEIDAAVEVARDAGVHELRLLHCVSAYPTPEESCNLAAIATLRERYGCPVGWSDHSADAAVITRAVQRWGASDVELHVDLDGEGNEAGEHNWSPDDLSALIRGIAVDRGDGDAVLPVDGDGVKEPTRAELHDVPWRADPSDGLRPLLATRQSVA
jgi:N-acetylneuraminate synthase